MLPAPTSRSRLLVVAPHPDDESIATGELIQQVRQAGGEVRVLMLTDGDNNPWPQRWVERRLWIGPKARQRWGQLRQGEAQRALHELGVEPAALHPLGWPDMGLTALLRHDMPRAVAGVLAELERFQPDLVALPSLHDHHPDHGAAHVLVRLALAQWPGRAQALAYLVHGREPGVVNSVAPAPNAQRHTRKLAALEHHRSQMQLAGKRMRRLAGRPERYESLDAATPTRLTLPWQPAACWHPWLRLTLATPDRVQTWPLARAPLVRDGQGGFALDASLAPATPAFAKLHADIPSPWIFDRWGWHAL